MNNKKSFIPYLPMATAALILCGISPTSSAQEEFDEIKVLIEINATDGDAGFHVLGDAEAWKKIQIRDPNRKKIFMVHDFKGLRKQGLTEIFFESAEPLCAFDPEEPEAEVVPLSEFLERFPAGDYTFKGQTIERDKLRGEGTLTYNLPAAPDISATDGRDDVDPDDAVISWMGGVDLGEKCHDAALVNDGTIADPAGVAVVGWEVVVEPDDEEASDPLRVFSVQLPPGQMSVTIPPEYLDAFVSDDVTEFKFEVGAIEESGNQTFSEGTFEVED